MQAKCDNCVQTKCDNETVTDSFFEFVNHKFANDPELDSSVAARQRPPSIHQRDVGVSRTHSGQDPEGSVGDPERSCEHKQVQSAKPPDATEFVITEDAFKLPKKSIRPVRL